ncbi:hypothetical protein Trydic_g4774 [Trypoxylus dichotomus]
MDTNMGPKAVGRQKAWSEHHPPPTLNRSKLLFFPTCRRLPFISPPSPKTYCLTSSASPPPWYPLENHHLFRSHFLAPPNAEQDEFSRSCEIFLFCTGWGAVEGHEGSRFPSGGEMPEPALPRYYFVGGTRSSFYREVHNGHTVLRLPPYHPDLNPIELIRVTVKHNVAERHVNYKMEDVRKIAEFSRISQEVWQQRCEHVNIDL